MFFYYYCQNELEIAAGDFFVTCRGMVFKHCKIALAVINFILTDILRMVNQVIVFLVQVLKLTIFFILLYRPETVYCQVYKEIPRLHSMAGGMILYREFGIIHTTKTNTQISIISIGHVEQLVVVTSLLKPPRGSRPPPGWGEMGSRYHSPSSS